MVVIEDVENTETYEGGHQMLTGPSTWRGQLLPCSLAIPRSHLLPCVAAHSLSTCRTNWIQPVGSCPGSACTSQWLPRPWRSGSCFCVLLSSPLSLYHSICVLYRPSLWTTSYFVFYIVYLGLVCLSQWNVSSVKHEGHVAEVSLGLASAWNIVGA